MAYHNIPDRNLFQRKKIQVYIFLDNGCTTPDLHITTSLITAGFVRTGSDVPSLPVPSFKMRK